MLINYYAQNKLLPLNEINQEIKIAFYYLVGTMSMLALSHDTILIVA